MNGIYLSNPFSPLASFLSPCTRKKKSQAFKEDLLSKISKICFFNDKSPSIKSRKIVRVLDENSHLPPEKIDSIICYLKNNLKRLIDQAYQTQIDLHLRPQETGLALPLEITKSKDVMVPLKCYGEFLGKGKFRKTKQAILLSQPHLPLVAHSTEPILNAKNKNYSICELHILTKISDFIQAHPDVKGLLRYICSVNYSIKARGSEETWTGYETEEPASIPNRLNEKHAIATKFYNFGNLQQCLHRLNLNQRIQVACHILTGLVCLHYLKIFHSDLKLDNIFVEMDLKHHQVKDAVIGDYGFACDLSLNNDRFFKNGHLSIRAPELLNKHPGHAIDESVLAADVYSMGLVLKALLFDLSHPTFDHLIDDMMKHNPFHRPSAQAVHKTFYQFVHKFQTSDNLKCFSKIYRAFSSNDAHLNEKPFTNR